MRARCCSLAVIAILLLWGTGLAAVPADGRPVEHRSDRYTAYVATDASVQTVANRVRNGTDASVEGIGRDRLFVNTTAPDAVASVAGVRTVVPGYRVSVPPGSPRGAASNVEGALPMATIAPEKHGWGYRAVRAWAAPNLSALDIAVVNTGVNYTIDELTVAWGAETVGLNTTTGRAAARDCDGHGTSVTSIVAAEDDSDGLRGLAPEADLYAIRTYSCSLEGAVIVDYAQGIRLAVRGPDGTVGTADDADVISLSLATRVEAGDLVEAVTYARENGAVVVAAAGNGVGTDRLQEVLYPAAIDGAIAVGAMARNRTAMPSTARGPAVDLAAPGEYINGYGLDGKWYVYTGTSYAVPFVTVAAAGALARGVTPQNVSAVLRAHAVDIGPNGTDELTGAGLVQYNRSGTTLSRAPVVGGAAPPRDPDGDGDYEDVDGDESVTVVDVAVLLDAVEMARIREYALAFDFNRDGMISIPDVEALLDQL